MTERVRWGVMGAAKIAVEKVIPAMKKGERSEVWAVASRDLGRAQRVAKALGIPKAYGSYEELLADPEVEAVYNPLPNHLHVPWSVKAAEAGKHVLCEKPVGMNADEARRLLEARDRTGVKIQEAFMTRTHPQWLGARDAVRSGRIGDLRAATCFFSYFNRDPGDVRNRADAGRSCRQFGSSAKGNWSSTRGAPPSRAAIPVTVRRPVSGRRPGRTPP